MIKVADGLDMDPSAAATQTLGGIGAKGSGKSYLGSKFFEQLYDNQCPGVVIDPVGNWWAVKLGADGVSPGLSVPVIGGEHGDVELDPTRGADIAQFLVESNGSAIIDVSELSKTKRKEFVADFCEGLFRTARKNRSPRMVIFEEAQLFAPQHTARGEERMLGAVTDIVRLGRNYGLGSMLLSQRPQSVNKEVLNQVECLFVGALRGPHERKAIAGWVTEQGVDLTKALAELPTLAPGEFFCWSPSWLRLMKRVRILPKRTFDGSSTPTLTSSGAKARPKLAEVDVEALRELLADKPPEVPEPAIHYDDEGPIEWGGTEREKLEEQLRLANAHCEALQEDRDQARRELDGLHEALDMHQQRVAELGAKARDVATALGSIEVALSRPRIDTPKPPLVLKSQAEIDAAYGVGFARMPEPGRPIEVSVDGTIGRRPRSMPMSYTPPKPPTTNGASASYNDVLLGVIAQHGPVDRKQLSILSGKSRGSSTFRDALRALSAEGSIAAADGGKMVATARGKSRAKPIALPKGRELYAYWLGQFGEYEQAIFAALARAPRRALTRKGIGEATGKSTGSSTFRDAIRKFKTLGLVDPVEVNGVVRMSNNAVESMKL